MGDILQVCEKTPKLAVEWMEGKHMIPSRRRIIQGSMLLQPTCMQFFLGIRTLSKLEVAKSLTANQMTGSLYTMRIMAALECSECPVVDLSLPQTLLRPRRKSMHLAVVEQIISQTTATKFLIPYHRFIHIQKWCLIILLFPTLEANKIVEQLLTNGFREVVDINATNQSGKTALDFLREQITNQEKNVDIENIIQNFGAVSGKEIITIPPIRQTSVNKETLVIMEKLFKGFPMEDWAKEIENSPSETRSILMVVAVLIATVTFQAILSPPGGFNNLDYHNKWFLNEITNMAADNPMFFVVFSIMNSIGFVTSLAMITVLTRRFPLKALLRLAVLSMATTYLCSIVYIDMSNTTVVSILALLMLLVLVVQWFHLKLRSVKKDKKSD